MLKPRVQEQLDDSDDVSTDTAPDPDTRPCVCGLEDLTWGGSVGGGTGRKKKGKELVAVCAGGRGEMEEAREGNKRVTGGEKGKRKEGEYTTERQREEENHEGGCEKWQEKEGGGREGCRCGKGRY